MKNEMLHQQCNSVFAFLSLNRFKADLDLEIKMAAARRTRYS